ncbi:FkbM family methyltransferase [Mycolicibacterium psychrotolerans]|uniref:FkbM family methyltransferase n=1 Tax=Mycolicibacterium psychrotolerans TaxID=216929 RepID=UPI003D673775
MKALLRNEDDSDFAIRTRALLQEEPELEYLLSVLPSDSKCIDVGGNLGYFSYHLCHTFPEGKVAAFEARRDLFKRLCNNLGGFANFRAYNLAISDKAGELEIVLDPSHANSSVENLPLQRGMLRQKVRATSIDDFFPSLNFESLDFLKIDVEGHESKVLQGASETIKRFRPVILCESENRHLRSQGDSVERIITWVQESFDYNCFYYRERQLRAFSTEIVPQDRVAKVPSYIYNWIFIPAERVSS